MEWAFVLVWVGLCARAALVQQHRTAMIAWRCIGLSSIPLLGHWAVKPPSTGSACLTSKLGQTLHSQKVIDAPDPLRLACIWHGGIVDCTLAFRHTVVTCIHQSGART